MTEYYTRYKVKYYYDNLFEIIILYTLSRAATTFPRACVMMDLEETHFSTVNNIIYYLLYYYFTVINILIFLYILLY